MKNKKYILIALAIIGIALGIIEHRAAFVYSIVGLFLLMSVQFSVMFRGKPSWILMGGNPTLKLNSDEKPVALIGLVMLVSGMGTFFIKVAILSYAL